MKLIRMMLLSVAVVSLLPAAAAEAQDQRLSIDQIGNTGEAATDSVQQISRRSSRVDTPARAEPRTIAPPPQLSSGEQSALSTRQLTSEGRVVKQPAQLYSGGPTAQPSEPLSRPSQGRTGAIARVDGKDRCDAASDKNREKACEQVIETRSAEFTRPDPTVLSPEQRLMVDQRLREAPANVRSAARRLAATGTDADSDESQSIASIVLRGPAPAPAREDKPTEEQDASVAEAAAIVTAIINAGNGAPQ